MSPTDSKVYGDGFTDGFEPVEPIDVRKHESVSELLRAYSKTSFGGRSLGEAAEVLEEMVADPKCFVVMTLSGAMTVAKQGLLICEMIELGWVQAIVSTGALMSHGFVESMGGVHFKYKPSMNDEELYKKGYDRVYDTLELEKNLDDTELIIRDVIDQLPEDEILSSSLIFRSLGEYFQRTLPEEKRAILKSAYVHKVPIFVPAFTDSEMGLDIEVLNIKRELSGKKRRLFDPYLDIEEYARHVCQQERCGIFTIGGGVPRNWGQQIGPMLDIIEKRLGLPGKGFRFAYGVRVCPEPVHWGGLSGCTYSEGVSWGKFIPESEGGRFAEVYADATIIWPLLVRALLERLGLQKMSKNVAKPLSKKITLAKYFSSKVS